MVVLCCFRTDVVGDVFLTVFTHWTIGGTRIPPLMKAFMIMYDNDYQMRDILNWYNAMPTKF
jgi:hypothetical protein